MNVAVIMPLKVCALAGSDDLDGNHLYESRRHKKHTVASVLDDLMNSPEMVKALASKIIQEHSGCVLVAGPTKRENGEVKHYCSCAASGFRPPPLAPSSPCTTLTPLFKSKVPTQGI